MCVKNNQNIKGKIIEMWKNKNNRKKIIIPLFISASGILVILATVFTNNSILCQSERIDKLLENQYFSTIQSSALCGVISSEISGNRAKPDFVDTIMGSASKTQKDVLGILKDKKCDKWISLAQIFLTISFLINIIIVAFSLSWNHKAKNGVEFN